MSSNSAVRLGNSEMGEVRHACAFFSGFEEAYRVLLPFIEEGFDRGDRAIHIVSPEDEAEHLQRLAAVGIDPVASRATGQLELLHTTDVYHRGDCFDKDRMLETFEAIASASAASEFPMSRIVCNMDWTGEDRPEHEDLIEFEARVNDVWRRHPDVVICAYDLRTLTGDMLIDIMRTHPMVLIGNSLQQNPFFIEPEQFLRERTDR
ncbi:hypothetical protein GON01_06620 [Sphingomonas sp. MAH-20]|uniref:MEDS domain-containing protein n=1 Tax=Sphingomonas horti TaxID=2682842 RepID=A0A6I4IZL2_9SPHN|nr:MULTISPECIES: MEDS domain-containing protein [Sphingomonas]MBA2920671.1 MEDS domain-containing protein [Sphingomonas sp. CGMCC 1.13658]MVO77607.1 hypothetical protein [Sphingomonas horti]